MAKCKSCGAEIVWKKTPNGKNIPLDADSEEKMAMVSAKDTDVVFIGDCFRVHWATCHNADQHRKARD